MGCDQEVGPNRPQEVHEVSTFLAAVPAIDDFRAPWETAGGNDAEIDKPKLRRYIHGLMVDKAKAQDSRVDAEEATKAVEVERDAAKDELKKASPEESVRKIEALEKQVSELTETNAGLVKDKEITELRAEVLRGVDPNHAEYVRGDTKEELEKSLAKMRADFGLDEDDDAGRSVPRTLGNPSDPDPGSGPDSVDYAAEAAKILGGGFIR